MNLRTSTYQDGPFDELVEFLFARPIMEDFDERYTAFYNGYGSFLALPPENLLINVTAI